MTQCSLGLNVIVGADDPMFPLAMTVYVVVGADDPMFPLAMTLYVVVGADDPMFPLAMTLYVVAPWAVHRLTKTGSTEGVVRVNQKTEGATNQIKQRESSHEYD